MARSVVVKLTQQLKTVKKSQVVLTIDTDLEATGKGVSRLKGSPQDALIKVFARSKSNPAQILVATITSKIVANGKLASFDMIAAQFQRQIAEEATDNSVVLTFNSRTFAHPQGQILTLTVRLPDAPPGLILKGDGRGKNVKVGDFELGAELSIAGAVETPAFSDVAHVPLRHEQVQDDTETALNDLNLGATTVYPVTLSVQAKTFPPPRSLKLPIRKDTFEILLHPRVKTTLDRNSNFLPAKLVTDLRQIFSPVFSNINVELLAPGDARLQQWKQVGTQTHSTTINAAKAPLPEEGHLIPFFQFWVSTARPQDLPSPPTEADALALAEVLAAPAFYFSAKTRQKRIQQPAHLLLPGFLNAYRNAKGNDANIFAANVIAHEVGHGLGLSHIKRADDSYAVQAGTGLMSSQFKPDAGNPPLVLKRLRPVHEAVLKHHYL